MTPLTQAVERLTIFADGEVKSWFGSNHLTGGVSFTSAPAWRNGDEMTGGIILPRVVISFTLRPAGEFSAIPEEVLEHAQNELELLGGSDVRHGSYLELLIAEFYSVTPHQLGTLCNWWQQRAAALRATAALLDTTF